MLNADQRKCLNAILDENVDIHLTCSYFSQDVWMIVDGVLQQKRVRPSWVCTVCQHDLHSEPSIICESCLEWFHFCCVGLTGQPKKELVLSLMPVILTIFVIRQVFEMIHCHSSYLIQSRLYNYNNYGYSA